MKEHIAPRKKIKRPETSLKQKIDRLNLKSLMDKFAAVGIILALTAVLLHIPSCFFQPLNKSRIEIRGDAFLSQEKIIDYLDISADQSWIGLDPYVLALRLKKRLWIDKVMVRKNFPFGLDVYVYEQKPAAYLKTGKEMHFITRNHLVLNILPSAKGLDLPIISDDGFKEAKPGDILPASRFRGAWELMKALEESRIIPPDAVSEILVGDPLNIQATVIPYGIKVKFGFRDFRRKLTHLYYVLPKIDKYGKNIEHIDLRHPRGVVIKKIKN